MKKGRKPKSKVNSPKNTKHHKVPKSKKKSQSLMLQDESSKKNQQAGIYDISENGIKEEGTDQKAEIQKAIKKQFEYIYEKSNDLSVFTVGPITRRKENQIMQSNGKNNSEKTVPDLFSLRKFDDYYKEKKNIDSEVFFYHAPRISEELYQVSLPNKLSDRLSIDDTENNKEPILSQVIFDKTKISSDDLGYYLKFIQHYKEMNSNVILKGAFNFEQNALELLRNNNYDLNLSMKKILFPVVELMGEEICLDNEMNYINSALNDLIGSSIQEKNEWLENILKVMNNRVGLDQLEMLLEMGRKMKIDAPLIVKEEKEKVHKFKKEILLYINSDKKHNLEELIILSARAETYKIILDEFTYLNNIIAKAQAVITKIDEIEDKCINYKYLQSIFHEAKCLPVNFAKFDILKKRYHHACDWNNKYHSLPKHSKTRQNNNNSNERCNITDLRSLIKYANDINFTSHDVSLLKMQYDSLITYENRILMTLEDENTKIEKEVLKEFIALLDSLKFTTSLYDSVSIRLEYFNWKEKLYLYSNRNFKMKHLRNLMREAKLKNLVIIPEVNKLNSNFELIDDWIDNLVNIFFKEEGEEGDEESGESRDEKNEGQSEVKVISLEELNKFYLMAKEFTIIPEEVEMLLIKCEEVFAFLTEFKQAEEAEKNETGTYDYTKLLESRARIKSYSISCEEFNLVDNQLKMVEKWSQQFCLFIANYETLETQFIFNFGNINSLEERQETINSIENYLENNICFYENLFELITQTPQFARKCNEFAQLIALKEKAEFLMDATLFDQSEEGKAINNSIEFEMIKVYEMSLDQLQHYIKKIHSYSIRRSFFTKLLGVYRAESWAHIASMKKKIPLADAEAMVREASSLKLDNMELENIKQQIAQTKEWLKLFKKIANPTEKINYSSLKSLIDSGAELPLHVLELQDLIQFQADLENDIFLAKNFIHNKPSYIDLCSFVDKIKYLLIEVPEFEILIKLKAYCDSWYSIASKIVNSRKICQLYFKPQMTSFPINDHIQNEEVSDNNKEEDDSINESSVNNTESLINKTYDANSKRKQKKIIRSNSNNVIENISKPNKKDSSNQNDFLNLQVKINLKTFNNCSFEERIKFLSQSILLRPENPNERYCICRRGDDSINYMLMCENCKEWFHGACMKITKSTAEKISQYLCLGCSRRKEQANGVNYSSQSHNYHYDFLNYRRISYHNFMSILREGQSIPVHFQESEEIDTIYSNIIIWKNKYEDLMKIIYKSFTTNFVANLHILHRINLIDDNIEKQLMDLYLQSESFQVELDSSNNLITILKIIDWFKEGFKCIENKKYSEKISKKVLLSSYSLFNKTLVVINSDIERTFFNFCFEKAVCLLEEVSLHYEKYSSISNMIKSKFDRKNAEIFEELIPQIEQRHATLSTDGKALSFNNCIEEVEKYIQWTNDVKRYLTIAQNNEGNEKQFNDILEQSKKFYFKTSFLEKFRRIASTFIHEQAEYYKNVLFGDDKTVIVTVNKVKKK